MIPLDPTPASFTHYHEIGGAVIFRVFDDADGTEDEAFDVICRCVPDCNADALRAIGFSVIDDAKFFGDWYDLESAALVRRGDFTLESGRRLLDAKLVEFEGERVLHGGNPVPEPGAGGNLAWAFAFPPYGLRATPREIQNLFDKIRHLILPPKLEHAIRDWTSPDLQKASPFFEAGMEWWGVFLFTLYVPAYRRLTVAYASTTD